MKISYNKILFAIMILICVIFIIFMGSLNILPLKYLIILIILTILYCLLLFYLLVYKKKKKNKKQKKFNRTKNIIGYVLSAISIMVMAAISYYMNATFGFFKSMGKNSFKEEKYSIIVLSDSNYDKISDLNVLGYTSNQLSNIEKAIDNLKKESNIKIKKHENREKMFEELFNKKLDSILIEDSFLEMYKEQNKYNNKIKVLDTITIKTEIKLSKEIDVTKKPFLVYISGIDSYGPISTVSRSDVNIVAAINPTTKQILLVTTPRDYYVQLRGTTGLKDKLTHAGIYGIESSIGTLEDLLEADINYYFRVNFSSVERIVDALGGVDAYSMYTFNAYPYKFYKGYNHLNGAQALTFARERHNVPGGDRTRGKNQQAVIDAIIRKATSPAIITSYNRILNSLKGTFQTNMDDKDIQKLIKMQLNDMASWNVTSYSLDGSDSSNYTYSCQWQKLYVMVPNIDSVKKGRDLIDQVLSGKKLTSSYDKEASNVKNPDNSDVVEKPSKPNSNEKKLPVITLDKSDLIISKGQKIDLLKGVTAKDKDSKNIQVTVNIKDTSVLVEGKHEIVYTAIDSENNKTIEKRFLIVKQDVNNDGIPDENLDEETKPEEIEPNEPKPVVPEPEKPKPDEQKPEETKPDEQKPEETKPDKPNEPNEQSNEN